MTGQRTFVKYFLFLGILPSHCMEFSFLEQSCVKCYKIIVQNRTVIYSLLPLYFWYFAEWPLSHLTVQVQVALYWNNIVIQYKQPCTGITQLYFIRKCKEDFLNSTTTIKLYPAEQITLYFDLLFQPLQGSAIKNEKK